MFIFMNVLSTCSLPVCGDLNGHHQEWLGSTTTNCHGVVDQLVVGPTHARGATLDLIPND